MNDLKKLIREYGTQRDFAQLAGISQTTLSTILNKFDSISGINALRVQKAFDILRARKEKNDG